MSEFDHPVDPPAGWVRDHVDAYLAGGGSDGPHEAGVPTLLITTLGRRSGEARRTALIYGRDGDRYLVVASNGGSDTAPAWYLNLSADPRVRLQVDAEVFDATAATADAAEKARLWPVMARIFPRYDGYEARSSRDIPLVVLTRVAL